MDKETVQLLIKFFQDAGEAVSPLVWVWMIGQNLLLYITWLLTFLGLYRLVICGIVDVSQESHNVPTEGGVYEKACFPD